LIQINDHDVGCFILQQVQRRSPPMSEAISVRPEELKRWSERLHRIGIPDVPSALPTIKIQKTARISRAAREFEKHYQLIKVADLAHLKELVGVPDHLLETNGKRGFVPYPMDVRAIPKKRSEDFSQLSPLEQRSVARAAKNMVYGHSQALGLSTTQYTAISQWILKYGGQVPWFLAPGLEVMDGQTVTLEDAAGYSFNWILVHGSGSIHITNAAKVVTLKMSVMP